VFLGVRTPARAPKKAEMFYNVLFKPRALKDISSLMKADKERIIKKIEAMQDRLPADVKKLTKFTQEYRLRVSDFRILFEIENGEIIVYRIINRRDAYKKRK